MDFELETKLAIIKIRRSLHKRLDGGPGSGNWGHKGRPGKIGGSQEGGGKHNRQKDKEGNFISFTNERKKAAQLHELTHDDVKAFSENYDMKLVVDGKHFRLNDSGRIICEEDGEGYSKEELIGKKGRVIIPRKMNPNYSISKDDKTAMRINKRMFDKAFNPETSEEADKEYRKDTGKVWNECTEQEKDALFKYTTRMFRKINGHIREADDSDDSINDTIANMTSAINKSSLKRDSVMYRGVDIDAAEKMFGLPEGYLSASMHANADNISMVGRIGTDDAFASCTTSKEAGVNRQVMLEIVAPKGTKAMYCEPFSAHGFGDKRWWDGKTGQDSFSHECEILLQRGCTFQVLEHEMTDQFGYSYHKLKVALIRQDPESSEYSKLRNK